MTPWRCATAPLYRYQELKALPPPYSTYPAPVSVSLNVLWGTFLILMAGKLLYKAFLWQSYPWSWKSWLSWRTRRSNLPSVSWRPVGTHQSWMALMTRYPRITWRTFFSLRAFFTFDTRLSLSEKKDITTTKTEKHSQLSWQSHWVQHLVHYKWSTNY